MREEERNQARVARDPGLVLPVRAVPTWDWSAPCCVLQAAKWRGCGSVWCWTCWWSSCGARRAVRGALLESVTIA